MNFNIFNRLTIKIAVLMVIASSIATSCSGHPSIPNNRDNANKDSIMRKAIGDSIYTIISEAKRIKADVIWMETDSISQREELIIKAQYIPLIEFVLSDPKIYNGSTPAYGSFMPCFSLTFIKKKESCVAKFDFGLKKWAICDDRGTNLKTFDLSSDDMLRVANLLFPDNKHFQLLINMEKK